MLRRPAIIVAFIALLAPGVFALTWQEAVQLAEQNNNQLQSAKQQLAAYEWSYKKAITNFLPQLSINAAVTETGSLGATSKTYSYGLSATQYLFKGLENVFTLQGAWADLNYYQANLKETKADVLYDVRSTFVDLLEQQKLVALLAEIIKRRGEDERLVRLQYEGGREDKGNLHGTQAESASAKYDYQAALRNLQLAQLKLSQLLQAEVLLASEEVKLHLAPEPELKGLVKGAPVYGLAKYQLEAAEIADRASISGLLPSVYVSGNYSNRGNLWPVNSENRSWSLTFSYPFFSGGGNLVNRAIYRDKLNQATKDFAKTIDDLTYTIKSAWEGFKDSLEALEVKKISLAAISERAKISRAKYLIGLTTYDEWSRIENDYINAEKTVLTAQRNALLAEAKWLNAYGGAKE